MGTEEDLAEDPAEALEEEAADSAEIEDLLRCMMLFAINAEKNAKFHLGQQETSLFFAVTASGKVAAVQEADHLRNFFRAVQSA